MKYQDKPRTVTGVAIRHDMFGNNLSFDVSVRIDEERVFATTFDVSVLSGRIGSSFADNVGQMLEMLVQELVPLPSRWSRIVKRWNGFVNRYVSRETSEANDG